MRDGETLDEERERAWLMVGQYAGSPKWWRRRHMTEKERWLLSYFEHWTGDGLTAARDAVG